MRQTVSAISLAALALVSSAVSGAAPPLPASGGGAATGRLTDDHRAALRCAAAFAIVALEQADGDAPEGWPPLALRGKQYFADTGAQVMREAALDRDEVRDLMTADVRALQAAPDPEAALAALAAPCTARLDAAVPPLATPDMRQCAAIMELAYEDAHDREGMNTAARDFRTLASVLAARAHDATINAGGSGNDADRALAEAREAMRAEAGDDKGGIAKYDIAHCYDLARPDEKSHY